MVWVMVNATPFSAERSFYRGRRGAELWMGVLRASFDVGADGRVKRAERQTVPRRAAAWTGEPGLSSLLDDSDFQARGGTDLFISGHAHAPGGKPAQSVDIGWRLGTLSKTVRVHGERVWVRSATSSNVVPGPARSFERVAVEYERAFGGCDPRAPAQGPPACEANPVGSGFSHRPRTLLDKPAPQLEYPGIQLVAGPTQMAPPGFGPVAPHWQPRVALSGTYDEAWKKHRAPLPPDDYDERFQRSAPQDQQLQRFLAGGEIVELSNMTPEGSFRVRLPEVRVHMSTVFSDGTEQCLARLQVIRIFPDERRLELSWLATTPCQGREHKLLRARLTCAGERSWQ